MVDEGGAIKKLALRGIRSFSPDEESVSDSSRTTTRERETPPPYLPYLSSLITLIKMISLLFTFFPLLRPKVIEFFSPLTMIVGANGCGKTTIIECLKYATTGILPPGAKNGQAFVHDPKCSGTSEVKAAIKLRFQARNGNTMVVVRSFQVTQLKASLRFKALDGTLRTADSEGVKKSNSIRCQELNKMLPEFLGVPQPILENVIFCHQEESNWPLQEGAIVKKKFDDIFESTRYTKALEAIKKVSKQYYDKGKDMKADVARLAAYMTQANEHKSGLMMTEDKKMKTIAHIESLQNDIEMHTTELVEVEKAAREIHAIEQDCVRIEGELSKKTFMLEEKRNSMPYVLDDSDEVIKQWLEEHESSVNQANMDAQAHRDEEKELVTKLDALDKAFRGLISDLGAADCRQHNLMASRNKSKEESKAICIKYPELNATEKDIEEKLRAHLLSIKESLDAHRVKTRENEIRAQQEVSKLEARYDANLQSKESLQSQFSDAESELKLVKAELQQIQPKGIDLPGMEEAKEKKDSILKALADLDGSNSNISIRELQVKVSQAQKDISALGVDISLDYRALTSAREMAGEQRDLETKLARIEKDKKQLAANTGVSMDSILGGILDVQLDTDATGVFELNAASMDINSKLADAERGLDVSKSRNEDCRSLKAFKQAEVDRFKEELETIHDEINNNLASGLLETAEKAVKDTEEIRLLRVQMMKEHGLDNEPQKFKLPPPITFCTEDVVPALEFLRSLDSELSYQKGMLTGRSKHIKSISKSMKAILAAHQADRNSPLGHCQFCGQTLNEKAAAFMAQLSSLEHKKLLAGVNSMRDKVIPVLKTLTNLENKWKKHSDLVLDRISKEEKVGLAPALVEEAQASILEAAEAEIEAEEVVCKLRIALSSVNQLLGDASRIAKDEREVDVMRRRLSEGDPTLEGRTLSEIEQGMKEKQDKQEHVRNQVDGWREELQSLERRKMVLITAKGEAEIQSREVEGLYEKKIAAEARKAGVQERVDGFQSQLSDLMADDIPLKQLIDAKASALSSIRMENQQIDSSLSESVDLVSEHIKQLQHNQDVLNEMNSANIDGQIIALKKEQAQVEEEMKRCEEHLADVRKRTESIEKGFAEEDKYKALAKGTLELRCLETQVKYLNDELQMGKAKSSLTNVDGGDPHVRIKALNAAIMEVR